MDARHYLELAEALVKDVTDKLIVTATLEPAACRSAVSRAYYAAFTVAHEFLDGIKVEVPQDATAHLTVYYALNNSGNSALAAVGTKLHSLHTQRNKADYKTRTSECEKANQVQLYVVMAKNLISELDTLASGKSATPFDPAGTMKTIIAWAKMAGKNVKEKK